MTQEKHKSMRTLAPAKINLTLDVGNRGDDGYHDVHSLMQALSLHDVLTVYTDSTSAGITLSIDGPEAHGVPLDKDNLVLMAISRLLDVASANGTLRGGEPSLRLNITKNIPMQAGLGGGSSDAAAALRLIDVYLNLNSGYDSLHKIASSVGCDVPYFLLGGSCIASGRGDIVRQIKPPLVPCKVLIVKPDVGVSTALAYAALDDIQRRKQGTATQSFLNSRILSPANDFEEPIFNVYPAIKQAHKALSSLKTFAYRPTLCGSGAAIFAIINSSSNPDAAFRIVQKLGIGDVWLTETAKAYTNVSIC